MAKLKSVILLAIVTLVIIEASLTEAQTRRPRTRKGTTSKRKKVPAVLATTTTAAPVETTTVDPLEDLLPESNETVTTEAPEDLTTTLASLISEDQSGEARTIPPKRNSKLLKRNHGGSAFDCAADGECDQEDCAIPDLSSCPTGLVKDRCNCCLICAAGEGNRCNDPKLNLPFNPDIGICGSGLLCKIRPDLEPTDTPEALCECRDKRIVCGSDNRTYSSECKLREAAHANTNLMVVSWSPCVSAPWISTAVDNATVAWGEEVALSCEVKGYPPPVIHWEFVPDGGLSSGPLILPGDDSSLVVVVRGGPEQMMTTSWIQIINVNPRRQGQYSCIAKNSEGLAQSSASVSVYKN